MSERGVFAMDRGWFDHPVFADEPYTEREAWAWLISESAWKGRTRRIGNVVVELKRGQVAASLRFMGEKWGWHYSKVVRFLAKLAAETMCETASEQGITVITICNYNKYQKVSLPADIGHEIEHEIAPQQQRNKTEDIKNIEIDDDGDARGTLVSASAIQTTSEIGKACGFKDATEWPLGWGSAAPMRVQTWLNEGWLPEQIIPACRDAMARKRDGPPSKIEYFEKPIAQFIARQAAPLPKVETPKQETIYANSGRGDDRSNGLRGVIQRLRSETGGGEAPSGPPPRLLSHG